MKHLIRYFSTNLRCHCKIGGTTVRTPYTLTTCGELVCSCHEPEKLAMNGKQESDCPDCLKLSKIRREK